MFALLELYEQLYNHFFLQKFNSVFRHRVALVSLNSSTMLVIIYVERRGVSRDSKLVDQRTHSGLHFWNFWYFLWFGQGSYTQLKPSFSQYLDRQYQRIFCENIELPLLLRWSCMIPRWSSLILVLSTLSLFLATQFF